MAKSKATKCKTNCNKNSCSTTSCKTSAPAPTALRATVQTKPIDQEIINNPVAAIKTHAINFDSLYANYNLLRNLARPLNGLAQTDEFPKTVKIKSITIAYELDGAENQAAITKVKTVGEIAPLLAAALRGLIDDIQDELTTLDQTTTAVKNAVVASRNIQKQSVAP